MPLEGGERAWAVHAGHLHVEEYNVNGLVMLAEQFDRRLRPPRPPASTVKP